MRRFAYAAGTPAGGWVLNRSAAYAMLSVTHGSAPARPRPSLVKMWRVQSGAVVFNRLENGRKPMALKSKSDSTANQANASDGPKGIAPTGQKMLRNLGPGSLYPGAGKLVQRSGQPLYCGTMTGHAFAYTQHPNSKDAKRTSTRFAGSFVLVGHTGEVMRAAEVYLPGVIESVVKAALDMKNGNAVPFSAEIFCEPDAAGRPESPLGYSYVVYNKVNPSAADPVLALAYETGVLERPKQAQLGIADDADYEELVDPETGEITRVPKASDAGQLAAD